MDADIIFEAFDEPRPGYWVCPGRDLLAPSNPCRPSPTNDPSWFPAAEELPPPCPVDPPDDAVRTLLSNLLSLPRTAGASSSISSPDDDSSSPVLSEDSAPDNTPARLGVVHSFLRPDHDGFVSDT